MAHTPAQAARQQGFTLLEVMVALTVGGIALGSMYAVGRASTRHFREQQRISATQTSLRAAMDQLKADFQRAGFLGTPNAQAVGETCVLPKGIDTKLQMAAVALYSPNVTPPKSLDRNGLNPDPWFKVDDVWLTGNYATSGEYAGITLEADNQTVDIPLNWQSFRRDFTEWSGATAGDCNAAAFKAAFPVGRLVRLHGLTERNFYSIVRRADCLTGATVAHVVLSDAVPSICNVNGGWIAPINLMRYSVVDASPDYGETSRIGDNLIAILRRTEMKPDDRINPLVDNNVPLEDRALLDYVVRFNVQFMLRMPTSNQVDYVPVTAPDVFNAPERVRGVVLELAARTAEQEPAFQVDLPRAAFRLYPNGGAARVRRMRAEMLMSNIAARGL